MGEHSWTTRYTEHRRVVAFLLPEVATTCEDTSTLTTPAPALPHVLQHTAATPTAVSAFGSQPEFCQRVIAKAWCEHHGKAVRNVVAYSKRSLQEEAL